jgi:hypothetical protein
MLQRLDLACPLDVTPPANVNLRVVPVCPDPTRAKSGGRAGRRGAGAPSETTGKRTGELLVAHRGRPMPEVLYQTQLLECELVAEPRKRAFEIPPRLLQRNPASVAARLARSLSTFSRNVSP